MKICVRKEKIFFINVLTVNLISVIIHLQRILKGAKSVATQNEDKSILDEITDSASELPSDCQDWILAMIKAMVFTKNYLVRRLEQPDRPNATAKR